MKILLINPEEVHGRLITDITTTIIAAISAAKMAYPTKFQGFFMWNGDGTIFEWETAENQQNDNNRSDKD